MKTYDHEIDCQCPSCCQYWGEPSKGDPESARPSEEIVRVEQVVRLLEDAHRDETRLTTELRNLCVFEAARKHEYAAELLGGLLYEARQQPNRELADETLATRSPDTKLETAIHAKNY